MRLSQHLLAGILKKAAVIFGALLIVSGFLFWFSEFRPDRRSGTGTSQYNQFEGGFWGIVADDGKLYDISSDSYFPAEFHVDGLRVGFIGYLTGSRSYHMWGKIITLIEITRI